MRKNEFSKITFRFQGRFIHPNDKEVTRYYDLSGAVISKYLDQEIANPREFTETIVGLGPSSQKYRSVGLHSLAIDNVSGKLYYHFQVGFIYRDQEQIETYDEDSEQLENITIDGKKYRHIRLHFTLVPNDGIIILDNKCHATPTKKLLISIIESKIDATTYLISDGDSTNRLRIAIVPVPKDDFESILNQKFRRMKEFTLSFAKLSKTKEEALPEEYEPAEDNSQFAEVTESIMAMITDSSDEEIQLKNTPFKSIKVTVQFDEAFQNAGMRLTSRNKAKDALKLFKENRLISEASFKYPNDEGDIEQVLLNSAKLVVEVSVPADQYQEADLMWKEQREAYKKLVRNGKI